MGSLGPVHYYCPAHFLSCKLAVVRGLGCSPILLLLDWGLWVIGGLLPHPMPGLPCLVPHQKPEIPLRYPCVRICGRDWDKTTKAPLFFYSSDFVMHLLHFFLLFATCAGSPICFGGGLVELLRLYLVFTHPLGCLCIFRVGSWSVK